MQGDRVLVPAGSFVRGIVRAVARASRTHRTGELTLAFDEIVVDGRSYPLRPNPVDTIKSEGLKGELGKIAAGAGVGGIVGGIIGGVKGAITGILIGAGGTIAATEGKDVELPAGTVLRLRLDEAVYRSVTCGSRDFRWRFAAQCGWSPGPCLPSRKSGKLKVPACEFRRILGGRSTVGQQTLTLLIGVRIPASQPTSLAFGFAHLRVGPASGTPAARLRLVASGLESPPPSHKFPNQFHCNNLEARIAILAIVTHRADGTCAASLSTT